MWKVFTSKGEAKFISGLFNARKVLVVSKYNSKCIMEYYKRIILNNILKYNILLEYPLVLLKCSVALNKYMIYV